jgi:hypothetical protein
VSFTTDAWSDTNLTPFLAVTAHWIKAEMVDMPTGPQLRLSLQSDLIGFLHLPGRHTGYHLATAFLYILDRVKLTDRVCYQSSILQKSDLTLSP